MARVEIQEPHVCLFLIAGDVFNCLCAALDRRRRPLNKLAACRSKPGARRKSLESIFRGKHNRQNPDGALRIARVLASFFHARVVAVDLQQNPMPVVLKGSKIALPAWIVFAREGIEGLHFSRGSWIDRSVAERPCRAFDTSILRRP